MYAGYGQSVKVHTQVTVDPAKLTGPAGNVTAGPDVRALNAARLQIADQWGGPGLPGNLGYPGDIGFDNMFTGDEGIFPVNVSGTGMKFRTVWLGGEQYFRVTYSDSAGRADTPVTYRIAVQVIGEETEGPHFSSVTGPGAGTSSAGETSPGPSSSGAAPPESSRPGAETVHTTGHRVSRLPG